MKPKGSQQLFVQVSQVCSKHKFVLLTGELPELSRTSDYIPIPVQRYSVPRPVCSVSFCTRTSSTTPRPVHSESFCPRTPSTAQNASCWEAMTRPLHYNDWLGAFPFQRPASVHRNVTPTTTLRKSHAQLVILSAVSLFPAISPMLALMIIREPGSAK